MQQLEQQMQRAQQQFLRTEQHLAQAVAVAGAPLTAQEPAASAAEEGQPGADQAAPPEQGQDEPGIGVLQQQLAQQAAQLEQLEFERTELAVKLEESEQQVAALTAAVSAQQQRDRHSAAGEAQAPAPGLDGGDGGGSGDWQLAAGSRSPPASQREEELHQQAQQLQGRIQQLESQAARLQEELAAAGAGSSSVADATAAAADLRRQLQERSQEVADLSALSIKADATVQQYMVQLRRWVGGPAVCGAHFSRVGCSRAVLSVIVSAIAG